MRPGMRERRADVVEIVIPGGIILRLDAELRDRLAGWIDTDRTCRGTTSTSRSANPARRARLRVATSGGTPPPAPKRDPLLRLGSTRVWGVPESRSFVLHSGRPPARGRLEADAGTGAIRLVAGPGTAAGRLDELLTVAVALLLNARGTCLVHAAAVRDPEGGGWLVTGPARSGKSTTAASLARADGWALLSDDQAVIASGEAGPVVEGWPRPVRLDPGWPGGPPTGEREKVPPETVGLAPADPTVLSGVVIPRVEPGATTTATRIGPARAMAALLRQSPWLLADGASARRQLELIEAVVAGPAFALTLGADSFGDPEPILAALDRGSSFARGGPPNAVSLS